MANIKKQVAESLKWKKNTTYCSAKLGITESKYLEIKQDLKSERRKDKQKRRFFFNASKNAEIAEAIDLEKGEGKISGTFAHEPKSPEEIISLLNIDTTIWKLSQYWNKQMGDHWRVSALVSRVKETTASNLEELLKDWKPKTYKIPKVDISKINNGPKVCGVMSLQDIHFGKEGNETIDKDFEDTVINLLQRAAPAHYIEKLYFVVGGDLQRHTRKLLMQCIGL